MGRPGLCAVQHSVISGCYLCIITVQVTNALIYLMKSNNTGKGHNEARSRNHFCCGKAIILHIMSVCLYSLLPSMQSECAVLYCHMWPYFSKLSHKHHDFRGKKLLHIKWVFSLQIPSEIFLILRRINPLNAKLNATCPLLALLGAHHILYIAG
jgi:hypothetical protein